MWRRTTTAAIVPAPQEREISTDRCRTLIPSIPGAPPANGTWRPDRRVVVFEPSALDKLVNKVRGRHAERQFQALATSDPKAQARRVSPGKAAAYLIAALVNCLPLALLGLAARVFTTGLPSFASAFLGAIRPWPKKSELDAHDQPAPSLARSHANAALCIAASNRCEPG